MQKKVQRLKRGDRMKMKYVDTTVTLLFVASLIVIYFFWGCHLDLYVTILAAVIILAAVLVRIAQCKKLKELGAEEEKGQLSK